MEVEAPNPKTPKAAATTVDQLTTDMAQSPFFADERRMVVTSVITPPAAEPQVVKPRRQPIKLKEVFFYRRLKHILQDWAQYKDKIHKCSKRFEEETEAALYKQCQDYLDASTKRSNGLYGIIDVKYSPSKSTSLGRMYGHGGKRSWFGLTLQNITRAVRHTIARDLYWDFDLENAMPTLLSQWAEANGLVLPCLKTYVQCRKQMLEELFKSTGMEVADGKSFVCEMLNGKSIPEAIARELPPDYWVHCLYAEIQQLKALIKEKEPEIWALAQQKAKEKYAEEKKAGIKKPFYNPEGSMVALLYGEIENECLMAMYDMLEGRGLIKDRKDKIVVLVFDGIMVLIPPKRMNITKEQLCKDLTAAVYEQTGYRVKVHEKAMTDGLDIPSDAELEIQDMDVDVGRDVEDGDGDGPRKATNGGWDESSGLSKLAYEMLRCSGHLSVAEYVAKEAVGDVYKYCPVQKRWFTCINGIWDRCTEASWIEKHQDGNFAKECAQLLKDIRNNTFLNGVAEGVKIYLSEKNFGSTLDQNHYIISCKDVVYNLKTSQWEKLTPAHRVSKTTRYERPKVDTEIRARIMEKIKDLLIDAKDAGYVLAVCSTVLRGTNFLQKIYFFLGEGANGKTTILALLEWALGEYCIDMACVALTKPMRGQNDHSDWFRAFGNKLIIFQEPEEKDFIQTSTMKSLTGDGNITSRPPYGAIPVTFTPSFKILFGCNDIPNMHGARKEAVQRRVEALGMPYTYKFENDPGYEPTNPMHKIRDPTVLADFKTSEYGAQFLLILIDMYNEQVKDHMSIEHVRTDFHREATNNYFLDQDPVRKFFREDYIITKDANDHIEWEETFQAFKNSGFDNQYCTPHKFKKSVEGLGLVKTKSNSQQVIRGVKHKDRNDAPFPMATQAKAQLKGNDNYEERKSWLKTTDPSGS